MWLVYLAGAAASLEQGGSQPVPIGGAVSLAGGALYLYRADARGIPSHLRDCRRLALADAAVSWGSSRGHCRIWSEGGRVWVEDFGSDNGTWLERGAAWRAVGQTEARPGDRVCVGQSVFVVRADQPDPDGLAERCVAAERGPQDGFPGYEGITDDPGC
jgi:hypothetical protein